MSSHWFLAFKTKIKNINLFIKDKDRVLLLGSSGSGKSTILKLLYKYLQADRNKIFINNYDINDYSMSDIRSSITYVSQNELLFNELKVGFSDRLIFNN